MMAKVSPIVDNGVIVYQMLKAGYSLTAIAEMLGVSRPSVTRYAVKAGFYIPIKQQRRQMVFTCECCGKEYTRKPTRAGDEGTKYCSRECYFESIKAKPKKKYLAVHTCHYCGVEFETDRKLKKYCCEECGKAAARKRFRDQFVSVKETNEYVTKTCPECGREYKTNYMTAKRIYCSSKCAKKAQKRTRKHANRQRINTGRRDVITITKLTKRDKGRCQICGDKVVKHKGYYNPRAASIDHIIPLSKGGTHTWDNVQLACLDCNSHKSDSLHGVQMNLFVTINIGRDNE